MCFFNQSQCVWLVPQDENRESIQRLLEIAVPIQDKLVPQLDPIYIMNVVEDSPVYRSLMITHTGEVCVSTRSSAWVAETIFEQQGFRYDVWNEFWQEVLDVPRKSFPYVSGRTVYVKVTRGLKQSDWLNLSRCVSMDMWTSLRSGEVAAPCLSFYFQLSQCEKTCLGVRLFEHCAAVSRQLALAFQLRQAWHRYYEDVAAKHLPGWVVNSRDEWRERFALLMVGTKQNVNIEPKWLEVFQLYNAICAYVERGHLGYQRAASELLAHKHLDSLSLRDMLARYRQDWEKGE